MSEVAYAARLGRRLLELGRHAEAAQAFELALRAAPDDVELHLGLGEALGASAPRRAERVFRRALELDPVSAEAHNGLGCSIASPRRSEECFRRAVELEPMSATYRCNLAVSLLRQDEHAAAEVVLREALGVAPGDLRVVTTLGELLLDGERPDEAEPLFAAAVADLVVDGAHHRAAWSRYEHHDFAAADALFAACAPTDDDAAYAWIFYGLGRARALRGEQLAAVRAFRTAIRLAPAEPVLHQALGDALAAQRLALKAAAAHERARQLRGS